MKHSREVIDALGGTMAVSRMFNRAPSNASRWRSEGLPSSFEVLSKVQRELRFAGYDVTLENLQRLTKVAQNDAD